MLIKEAKDLNLAVTLILPLGVASNKVLSIFLYLLTKHALLFRLEPRSLKSLDGIREADKEVSDLPFYPCRAKTLNLKKRSQRMKRKNQFSHLLWVNLPTSIMEMKRKATYLSLKWAAEFLIHRWHIPRWMKFQSAIDLLLILKTSEKVPLNNYTF